MLVLLSSCVRTQMIPFQSDGMQIEKSYPPIDDPASVKIFLLERDIPLKIEHIGRLKINSSQVLTNLLEEKVKNECAKVGANGAYRIQYGESENFEYSIFLCFRY